MYNHIYMDISANMIDLHFLTNFHDKKKLGLEENNTTSKKDILLYRKKILQLAKGYRGAHSRLFRVANQQVMKALRYSYVGRKQKKRMFRRIWITRINAASRVNGLTYSRVIHNFKKSNIELNRKMLAQLAVLDTPTFNELINVSK